MAEWTISASDADMNDTTHTIELANSTNVLQSKHGLKLRHAVYDAATQMIAAYEQTSKVFYLIDALSG